MFVDNSIITGMATPSEIRKGARVHLYIKEWMEKLGVSDEAMAGRLNVARETVWRRYTEQNRLNPEKIAEFADALGFEEVTQLYYPPDVQSLDAIATGATFEQREMIADVVRRVMGKGK